MPHSPVWEGEGPEPRIVKDSGNEVWDKSITKAAIEFWQVALPAHTTVKFAEYKVDMADTTHSLDKYTYLVKDIGNAIHRGSLLRQGKLYEALPPTFDSQEPTPMILFSYVVKKDQDINFMDYQLQFDVPQALYERVWPSEEKARLYEQEEKADPGAFDTHGFLK